MQTVQKNIPDFKWITKGKRTSNPVSDVTVSWTKGNKTVDGKKRSNRALFSFHNKQNERITSTGYIMFGVDGNRCYFAEAEMSVGYKMSPRGAGASSIQSTDEVLVAWAKSHLGDYTIHQDTKSGLFYIDSTMGGAI